ncbi:MAG TPA: hypothetical protein VN680_00180 [Burkholderiaceae bacterium]|nr:hypothetical protein [Burkholderiaceae bacterium]
MSAQHTPGPWEVGTETYRKRFVFVVKRKVGRRTEYRLNERTERKARYFDASIAGRHADELNTIATAQGSPA